MCVQWWRIVLQCQTQEVQELSVVRHLDCQLLESPSRLFSSSASFSMPLPPGVQVMFLLPRLLPQLLTAPATWGSAIDTERVEDEVGKLEHPRHFIT